MNTKWIVAAVFLGLGTGLFLSRKPWNDFRQQQARTQEAKNSMKEAESQRAELLRQAASKESQIGREAIARERGYRKANEIPAEEFK